MQEVAVKIEKMSIPTYEAAEYEEMPVFAFNRSHQGTIGNPFPHRVVDRIRRDSVIDRDYTAVFIENEYLEIIVLPELGGRIFAAKDKTNGYDFFYRQHVIKPALIGIYGLWISGGLEFNWPRHHRPSTFMPTDFAVERISGGGAIVWISEHDPFYRMKGMVGVAMYPGKSVIETRMRVFNRTSLPHPFHWWENAAVSVNEDYQIFFPPDVTYVNYHYRKDTGEYPVMDKYFYVQDNRGGKDIRFHGNTENSTSYFSGESKYDFFGGYDHRRNAGLIHYASHYTSTGKKLFTWGYRNREKAWENALTDTDGPYAELMAGSFGDNQPDFTWIEPYETKNFTQVWYPYKGLGEVQTANEKAALNYKIGASSVSVGLYATMNFPRAVLEVEARNGKRELKIVYLKAAEQEQLVFDGLNGEPGLRFILKDENGEVLLDYKEEEPAPYVPRPLKNTPLPDEFTSADDCCIAGLHIDQYSDPIIEPSTYWLKGLSIDPNHVGCLVNLGRYHLARQNYVEAEEVLRKAAQSLTRYNQNPRDAEALYLLGLALAEQKKWEEALEILHKSRWSRNMITASSCCIANIYSKLGKYREAENLLSQTTENSGKNQRAEEMLITLLRKQGKIEEARKIARDVLAVDMLDLHALNELRLLGEADLAEERFRYRRDETGIDLAGDYKAMGLYEDGQELITWICRHEEPAFNVLYAAGYFASLMGKSSEAKQWYVRAARAPQGMRFCSASLEREALEDAVTLMRNDSRACCELGTVLFGVSRKTEEAILQWKAALQADPQSAMAMRNLAVGLFSKDNKDPEALSLLENALAKNPKDLQLIYERNIVAELQNIPPEKRLEMWKAQQVPPESWDEIYLQGVRLFRQLGEFDKAYKMILEHTFIPAEGGEAVLGSEYGSILEAMANNSLREGKPEEALGYFVDACNSPLSIGGGFLHEVNKVPYKYGQAQCLLKLNRKKEAEEILSWIFDFPVNYFSQTMLPSLHYYRGMALIGLGKEQEGKKILKEMKKDIEYELSRKEYGQFAATSAYCSFIRDPVEQRRLHYGALLTLVHSGLGE
jgi:tetratricopeptide (TPR) repeat protein